MKSGPEKYESEPEKYEKWTWEIWKRASGWSFALFSEHWKPTHRTPECFVGLIMIIMIIMVILWALKANTPHSWIISLMMTFRFGPRGEVSKNACDGRSGSSRLPSRELGLLVIIMMVMLIMIMMMVMLNIIMLMMVILMMIMVIKMKEKLSAITRIGTPMSLRDDDDDDQNITRGCHFIRLFCRLP